MKEGFNRYGVERCIRKNGCIAPPLPPPPVLSELDRVAWRAFKECSTQWEVGFNGRTGLKYSEVRVWLEANGYRLNGHLLKRIQRLELLTLSKQSEDRDDSETVN